MNLPAECMIDGRIDVALVAEHFGISSEDVWRSAGIDCVDALASADTTKDHLRLRDMLAVLNAAEPRFGGALPAYEWYREVPLPGHSGSTAMQLVAEGRGSEVLDVLDAIDTGVFF